VIDTLKGLNADVLAQIAAEKTVRQTTELFILFALGSQYDHLIKQQLDKLGVFCLVADPAKVTADDIKQLAPTGLILSGGPASVHNEPPPFDTHIFDLRIPVLGICLGFQMWAQHLGAAVVPADKREYGPRSMEVIKPDCSLFNGLTANTIVLQSHGDRIEANDQLLVLASTDNAPVAAAQAGHLWGVQFHPEVSDTKHGELIFQNFCFGICGAQDRFPSRDVANEKILEIRELVGNQRVLLALSGGSDSSVVAYLLKEAIPGQVDAIYIEGIDRPDDKQHVLDFFTNQDWLEVQFVDATDQFLAALAGKTGMHDKRVAMRSVYKPILEKAAKRSSFIAQGTLATDVSESGGGYDSGARKAQIKLHHNINLGFTLPELLPLVDQVKDTGRQIGRAIGVPEELLVRHPFPGPGLVVRIEGEVTAQKLHVARQLDGILIEELRAFELYEKVWQAGAVVTQSQHTVSKGDDAGMHVVVAYWAVNSVNGFTAQAAELPWDFHVRVAGRMTDEVAGVAAAVYRTSNKPPSTIEWG
jgi:GMP synthase (glutamine-hydrolysing)